MMKNLLIIIMAIFTFNAYGQKMHNHVYINKLTEVTGTEYVIASINYTNKVLETNGFYLLFINTKSGETKQVDFPENTRIDKMEHIKMDNSGINLIIVEARTTNIYKKTDVGRNNSTQIIILSPDGKEKTQLTGDDFSARIWSVNNMTGTIVVAGNNGVNSDKHNKISSYKDDNEDKSEIHIYSLKTLKLISKM